MSDGSYCDMRFTSPLAHEVDERLPDDAVALARRGVDALGVEDLLDGQVQSHRLFEFGAPRVIGAALAGERPIEAFEKVDLVLAEPHAGCGRAVVIWHDRNCKAGMITAGGTRRRRAGS